jgi:hypothetical protein
MYLLADSRERVSGVHKDPAQPRAPLHGRDRTLTLIQHRSPLQHSPAAEHRAARPVRAITIDATGLPKKGRHSVSVAHQYCGQLGKQDNWKVAVSLSVAGEHTNLPIAFPLYLRRA